MDRTNVHRGANSNPSPHHGRRGQGKRGATTTTAVPSLLPSRSVQGTLKSNAPQTKPSAPSLPLSIPNRRKMNLMASVSRSSGLERDGDDLKNWGIQEEYRKFIQEKLEDVLKSRPEQRTVAEMETAMMKTRLENQENVLILFRKLREGVASTNRKDEFALEVYETSLCLSVIFNSPKQTSSIIPHLFLPESDPKFSSSLTLPQPQPSVYSLFCSLLHHLVAYFPCQGQYHQHLRSIHTGILPRDSELFLWFASLAKSLRMRNYAKLAVLTQKSTVSDIISQALKSRVVRKHSDIAFDAILCLLDILRRKAAEMAWNIIRSAYREFSIDESAIGAKAWLARSLSLESVYEPDRTLGAVEWMESKIPLGYVRKKEGTPGWWIVCKVR